MKLIRTSKFKFSFLGQLRRLQDDTFLLKIWLEYREWYCKYPMSLVIFNSLLSEIILIFSLRTWDIHVCINMKRYIVCQTIDYADVYEYKELSIPFWSTCMSSPLKYFMGFVSFVIVYFQQNKSLFKCMNLWLLPFLILHWYCFVVTFINTDLWLH